MSTSSKKISQNHGSRSREIKKLQGLVNASKILNSTLDLEKLLGIILDLATANLKAARGTIYLVDHEKRELWSKVVKGKEIVEIRLPLGKGIAGYVGKTGETVNIKDAWKDKRFFSGFDLRSGFQTKTMLCMPMKDREGKIIGVFQILNKTDGRFDKQDERFLEAFSVHAALAIENAKLHQAIVEKERMDKEIEIAGNIQRRLLPKDLPRIDRYEIEAMARPCRTIGGDYYDVIPLEDDRYAFIIADVSGKGIPAALLVSTLHASLHAFIKRDRNLLGVVEDLNKIVYDNTESDRYITFFMSILDTRTDELTYVNAGHTFPIITDHDKGSFRTLSCGGVPLGMFQHFPHQEEKIRLHQHELVVMYTDGVTEAMNKSFEEYGEERFRECIRRYRQKDLQEFKADLLADVESFTRGEPQSDDLTLMVFRRMA